MTYKVYDTLKYFEKYDGKRVRITSANEEFNILFNKYSIPHLLGLHYQYKKENGKYINSDGKEIKAFYIYNDIINKKISDQEILDKVINNNELTLNSVKQRINTFLDFMKNLEKGYVVDNMKPDNFNGKVNYFIIEDDNGRFNHLGIERDNGVDVIKEFNDSKMITYFKKNNDSYFVGTSINEDITKIEVYDNEIGCYIPFSFDEEKMQSITKEEKQLYALGLNTEEFDKKQIKKIVIGFEDGLTNEQIKMYAKPEFDYKQMGEIRWGIKSGLTNEQVEIYADPKFNWMQMEKIRFGFNYGLTKEQVEVYAKPEFDWRQMGEILEAFKNNLDVDDVRNKIEPTKKEKRVEVKRDEEFEF